MAQWLVDVKIDFEKMLEHARSQQPAKSGTDLERFMRESGLQKQQGDRVYTDMRHRNEELAQRVGEMQVCWTCAIVGL